MNSYLRLIILLLSLSPSAWAASTSRKKIATLATPSAWSVSTGYGFTTDLAEGTSARGYDQDLSLSADYAVNRAWNISGSLATRYTTYDGKIEKGAEQSHSEALQPSGVLSGTYVSPFLDRHRWRTFLGNHFLLDEASRREGYKALPFIGTKVSLNFWDGAYTMGHGLTLREVVNTFEYDSSGVPNPGTSVSYDFSNNLRIVGNLFAQFAFGVKLQRYLDGYVDYSYMNSWGLDYGGKSWSGGLSYTNGGYTENGRVELWFVDHYRRLVSVYLGYQF